MKSDVQVAVIGGGIVGASVLYWLAKMGWTDSVLLERRELTSGSTWHSAGNTTYFGPYPAMTRLFAGSIRTYLQAEEESGQSVSFHQTGGLRLAATERELRLFREYKAQYAELGIPFYVRTPQEVGELHPLIDTKNIFGAAHTPTDGHVDPVGATQALAKAASILGATVERRTTSAVITSGLLAVAARMRGVYPSSSCSLMFEPSSMSLLEQTTCPFSAAQWRAILFWPIFVLTFAPCSTSFSTMLL